MPQWGADESDGGNCWMLTYTDARETVSRSFWNTVFLLCIPELSKHTLTILPETAYGWTLLRVLPSARLLQQQLTEFGGVKGVAWLGIHYSQRCFDVKPLEGAGNAWKRRWGGAMGEEGETAEACSSRWADSLRSSAEPEGVGLNHSVPLAFLRPAWRSCANANHPETASVSHLISPSSVAHIYSHWRWS